MTDPDLRRHAERLLAAHALADADPAPLAGLLARSGERRLATGQPLFQEGDAAGELTFLLEGRVSVLKKDPAGNDRQIGSWFAPALVGGLAAVEGARRSASCVAGAPSIVATLPAADVRGVLADPGPVGAQLRFILLAAFTEALSNTTQHLRELLAESQAAPSPDIDRLLALLHGAKR
ncbi:MAG TPA: cyclic nucleotide-binding domain-containing protein [Polyangia bacterium]|nr:cyclic nucleotide-binding domain-containing protein [Polyangia bacterium]